jgi:glycosyltransferase involved in cell wall biosynthesis
MTSDAFDPSGPAVMLGPVASIFPRQLATDWINRGRTVSLVSEFETDSQLALDGVRLINSHDFRRPNMRWVRAGNPFLRWLERSIPKWTVAKYKRRTGRDQPEPWEWYWVDHFWDSFCRARAVLAQRPSFVFGHEASSHGLGTAMCKGVPRILFPWGGDIFNFVECSPFINAIVGRALRNVDLIVPSSTTAASYIPDRFGVSPENVVPVSWGVDLQMFKPAAPNEKRDVLAALDIPQDSKIVLNVRRFNPMWGAFDCLDACLKLASIRNDVHFIFFGGAGTEEHLAKARRLLEASAFANRFTLFEGNLPLDRCAEIMSIADVCISLLGRGDMRSSSVLQGAASGAVPIIAESEEYLQMQNAGFAAEFVPINNVDALATTLSKLIEDEHQMLKMRESNLAFIREHEDHERQMDHLLKLIDEVGSRYRNG